MFAHALALVTALLLVGHGPDRAWAGAPTDQLKAQIERTVKILEDPELKKPGKQRDRRAAVRQVATISSISRRRQALAGTALGGPVAGEREEFVQLFGDLLERSYISKIELYGGERSDSWARPSSPTARSSGRGW